MQITVTVFAILFKIISMGLTYITFENQFLLRANVITSIVAFFILNIYYINVLAIFFDPASNWKDKAPVIWGAHLIIWMESTVVLNFASETKKYFACCKIDFYIYVKKYTAKLNKYLIKINIEFTDELTSIFSY